MPCGECGVPRAFLVASAWWGGGGAGRQPTNLGCVGRQVTQVMSFCLGTDRRSNADHAAFGSLVCTL